jgi:2-oxoglutarate dehydrogenase E2 component (dihydrolipoamide succinyltransferase)
MKIEVRVPAVGESIKEAMLVEWYKKHGELVKKDDPLFVIETDKVTLEVVAEADGILETLVKEGETVLIGDLVATIDSDAAPAEATEQLPPPQAPVPEKAQPVAEKPPAPPAQPAAAFVAAVSGVTDADLSPAVRRLAAEKKVDVSLISGTGPSGRITKGDVLAYLERGPGVPGVQAEVQLQQAAGLEETERKPMSPIRKRIAERLLESKHNTAMLTTFNEIDMGRVMNMRSEFKDAFKERHDVGLGFMSFFVKASVLALKEFPAINAFIEGSEIVYHNYFHVSMAVGSPRGLVVPVIRFADQLSFAAVEQSIVDFVTKIKENRLELSDMEGGTFSITNGGVFGSLLSTPILNTPQSAILGLHKIEKRPVVINDEIVIRPMMYVALSYDHRIVDGREAVTFLKRIKECIENPERILMEV